MWEFLLFFKQLLDLISFPTQNNSYNNIERNKKKKKLNKIKRKIKRNLKKKDKKLNNKRKMDKNNNQNHKPQKNNQKNKSQNNSQKLKLKLQHKKNNDKKYDLNWKPYKYHKTVYSLFIFKNFCIILLFLILYIPIRSWIYVSNCLLLCSTSYFLLALKSLELRGPVMALQSGRFTCWNIMTRILCSSEKSLNFRLTVHFCPSKLISITY